MKKTLFSAIIIAMLALASIGTASAKPKDDTVVAVYPGDFIIAGGEVMVRVETVDSRKTNKMGNTKTYMRESDVPAHLLNGTPAPTAPSAKS